MVRPHVARRGQDLQMLRVGPNIQSTTRRVLSLGVWRGARAPSMQRSYSPVYLFLLSALRFGRLETALADKDISAIACQHRLPTFTWWPGLFASSVSLPLCSSLPLHHSTCDKIKVPEQSNILCPELGFPTSHAWARSLNRGTAIVTQLVEKVLVNAETNLQVATPFFSWLRTSQFSSVTLRMLKQYLNRLVTNSYLVITMHNHLQILFHAL